MDDGGRRLALDRGAKGEGGRVKFDERRTAPNFLLVSLIVHDAQAGKTAACLNTVF
jgi:hypothetical protein